MEQPSSNLFEGYRIVGQVTGPQPFIVRHGKNSQDTRIITIVGKTFHTYTTNLSLVEVSISHEHDISALIADIKHVYSASGRSVFTWGRGSRNLLSKFDNGHQANVRMFVKFGPSRILSVDEDNVLFNWDTLGKDILNILSFDEDTFKISSLCHPLNYQNKALLGSKQGALHLWNICKEECLYKFNGWESEVTCIVQSPVENVVGIGLADGHVYIHNIKYDEVVLKIYQEYGSVTSMSFRLDGQPYLVTASEVGHLMIWNLERKRLSSQIRNAHSGRISKCQFIRNECLLVTSGCDNTLKVWTLDMSDGCGTLLCQRAGHSAPPSYIRFYGTKGFNLLSAGQDSTLKMFHMYSERLNRNLGTARLNPKHKRSSESNNKLPPIVRFATESTKDKQWDSIAVCHKGSSLVTTWNYDKCRMGEHFINQPTFDKHEVSTSSICITGCGNFVIIGFSNGLIFKYNMQSGIFRQSYETSELSEHRAHNGPVTGLTVDSLDLVLISGGADCQLRFWNFKTGALLLKNECAAAIINLELHRENNLIAVALSNHEIEITDLETRTLIRRFTAKSRILDMTFSPDSRWLIVSYEDKCIRTWDLNLGKLIDAFQLRSPCTSLSISNTGEFLATAHEDSFGINVWCNHTIYCPTTLRPIDYESPPRLLDFPYVLCDETSQEDEESGDLIVSSVDQQLEAHYVSPDQLHDNLITMSGFPSSRWKNLLSIEELREKQLIEEEEKRVKPVKVPFFIPIKDGLKPTLDVEAVQKSNKDSSDKSNDPMSKILNLKLLSPLAQVLVECGRVNNYTPFLTQLKECGPSATDAEIRSLGKETCGDNQPMLCFLTAIEQALKQNVDYELVCSWLALFLKAHSDTIQNDSEVRKLCFGLVEPVSSSWGRLSDEFNQIFCVLSFVRSSIL